MNRQNLDNSSKYFNEYKVKDFVLELEKSLSRNIDEKYDMQKVLTTDPIGYLFWVTCITCGVTKVSTLLGNGFTTSVNIVSKGLLGKVVKALERKDILSSAEYKQWKLRKFHKPDMQIWLFLSNIKDSKK